MTSAYFEIRKTYDYEDAKQIVSYGCQSGVCHKHIYYGDTVEFFNKFEDEITEYVNDNLGEDAVESIWTENVGHIRGYKNDLVWCFIESVCSDIVDDYESTTCEEMDDEPIKLYADYSKEEAASLTKQGFEVVNSELLQDVMFGSHLGKATSMAMNAIL